MYDLRPYQGDAVEAVYRHLREKDTNPCVVIPTAGGKSLCIAQVAKDAVTRWSGRVMILAHVKELVEQNAGKLKAICPELPVGVYSAGLDRRDVSQPVVVAGIQSVYNRIDEFKPFDLVMIDEVHMVPPDGEGRYRTFLEAAKKANPHVRLVGWTATPYRTQGGLICKPENLLNEVCYEIGVKELINRGYISNITAKAGRHAPDTDGLHVRAGEFVAEDVEKLMGEDGLVNSACREIVELTKDRKACLVFCTSVAHCKKVAAQISRLSGEECAIVTGDTPAPEREDTIRRLRGESIATDLFGTALKPLKYCCNVSVLTTGTDIPRLDTIALLRPTNSPGLLVQMVGRGFRLSPETGKTECLVLDYGRNIERHGPIDMIKVREPGQGGGGPLAKVCPQCQAIVNLPVMLCPDCGYQWPRKEPERKSHEATAAKVGILSGEVTVEKFPVQHTSYQVWEKRGAPPDAPKTVRVTYDVDYLTHYSEWLCPEHTGYARRKFEKWWREHANPDCPMPRTAEEVCEHDFAGMIREVKEITVRFVSGQKYPEITGYELGDFPLVQSGQGTQGEEVSDEDWDDIPF
jgi:DNA repair protein RadD